MIIKTDRLQKTEDLLTPDIQLQKFHLKKKWYK